MPAYSIDGISPVVHPSAFVHPTAVLVGDVIIGPNCYVGPCASLPIPSSRKTATIVNSFDLNIMRANFGATGANDVDINCNGVVKSFDLTEMRADVGQPPGPSGL